MEALSSYDGQINITFQQSPSKDALYFRIELANTVWTPFTGQRQGIQEQGTLDKWLWDPITPLYNPLVTLTNTICSYLFGSALYLTISIKLQRLEHWMPLIRLTSSIFLSIRLPNCKVLKGSTAPLKG